MQRVLPALLLATFLPGAAHAATDLLPDVITLEHYLLDADPDWGVELGCLHMRFSNATANIGQGPAELFGVLPPNPDGSQNVYQRVHRDDGSSWERLAGTFIFHPTHHHIHFEGWAQYSLRELLPGGGVGPVLYAGDKTSFCLFDGRAHDLTLPGAPPDRVYEDCHDLQGISVGWLDRYTLDLPGQELVMCGITGGTYWLESEVDPENRMLELDETNNVSRVQVVIPTPPACNDGIDNDGDGDTDYPADPGCSSMLRRNEAPACNDGLNNDADTLIDFPQDPGCSSPYDLTEGNTACGLGFELALLLPLCKRRRQAARAASRRRA